MTAQFKTEIKQADSAESTATEVLKASHELACMLDSLHARINTKLGPYMLESREAEQHCVGAPVRQFPPYFDEMRTNHFRMHRAINHIFSLIENVEL